MNSTETSCRSCSRKAERGGEAPPKLLMQHQLHWHESVTGPVGAALSSGTLGAPDAPDTKRGGDTRRAEGDYLSYSQGKLPKQMFTEDLQMQIEVKRLRDAAKWPSRSVSVFLVCVAMQMAELSRRKTDFAVCRT